jgi:hypothetical protein
MLWYVYTPAGFLGDKGPLLDAVFSFRQSVFEEKHARKLLRYSKYPNLREVQVSSTVVTTI